MGQAPPSPGRTAEYPSSVPKWEYRVVEGAGQDRDLEARFNTLGGDGWELVAVLSHHANVRAVFKRQVDVSTFSAGSIR